MNHDIFTQDPLCDILVLNGLDLWKPNIEVLSESVHEKFCFGDDKTCVLSYLFVCFLARALERANFWLHYAKTMANVHPHHHQENSTAACEVFSG